MRTENMETVMGLLALVLMVTPVAAADDAEFAFNLLSDIAPVLALFGDQFARQFTSESLTWVDHLIFAMVPLGIITAITGAIRIQGRPIAKAFIGRARENRAQAEIELMSSTSGEVCEIFNGSSIVRAMGNPQIAQFLIFPRQYQDCEKRWKSFDQEKEYSPPETDPRKISCGIHSLETAQEAGHVECKEYLGRSTEIIRSYFMSFSKQLRKLCQGLHSPFQKSQGANNGGPQDTESAKSDCAKTPAVIPPGARRAFRAPNIQLNHTSVHFDKRWLKKHHEIFLAAVTGVLLQTGLILIAAMVAYHIGSSSSELFESKPYGFPCYAAGSLLLSLGTGFCSFIVEHSTDEYSWDALVDSKDVSEENAPRLLWLQNKQSVSDQSFNGYVIAAGPKRRIVTSSRRENPERHRKSGASEDSSASNSQETFWEWLTVGAALSAALGFTAQFMGLRGLAFPCSIAQLGAIFIMALIRAAIRRRLGEPMEHCHAFQWYEIDSLAMRIVFGKENRSSYWVSRNDRDGSDPKGCFNWRIITADSKEEKSRHFVRLAKHPMTRNSEETPEVIPRDTDVTMLKSPTSQQLLRVRRRLGNLAPWKTRSLIGAVALVQSIELVMDEFFPPSSNIKSMNWLVGAVHSTKTKRSEGVTSLSTENETHDAVQFKITRNKAGKFEVEIGLIDAAISLWMARIDAKKPTAIESGSEEGKGNKEKDWRRERSGDSLTYDFYRIIGNNFQDDALKRDISWWVDNLTAERSEPQPKDKSKSGKGEKGKGDAEIVIGFNGVEASTTQDGKGNPGDNPDKDQPTELGIYSEGSLPIILAQHLFTSFMWTIAQHLPEDCLQPQDGENQRMTEVDRHQAFESFDIDQTWPKLKLNHQRLDKLANMMETYGMGNRRDILLCIIPALSIQKLLPNQVVLSLVPRMKQGLGWSEIATCHKKLLDKIKKEKLKIDDKLDVGIVITALDFLSFACENYDEYNSPSKELNDKLEAVVQELSSDKFADVFKRLAPVYSRQHRREMFGHIFERFKCPDPMTASTEELDESFAKNTLGFTPHHISACKDTVGFDEFVHHLLRTGKPIKAKDIFGWTPHHYHCFSDSHEIFWILSRSDGGEIAEQICGLRCDYLRSPFDIICLEKDNSRAVRSILDPLNAEDRRLAIQGCGIDGMTPLHLIAKSGNLSSLQLIARQVTPLPFLHKPDFWGRQALHIAARSRHEDVTIKLLELGAHSNSLDGSGKSSVDYYLESLGVKRVESQVNSPQQEEADVKFLDPDCRDTFLKFAMKDPNCRYRHERTFLHIAVEVGDMNSIRTLLQDGFSLDVRDIDGRTPLHIAILAGREDISKSLIKGVTSLKAGQPNLGRSNPSLKDNRNTTTFMMAAERGLRGVANVLVEAQGRGVFEEIDDNGKTPFLHAKNLEMVRFLVNEGAKTDLRDSDGRTRLHMALSKKDKPIASFLLHLQDPKKAQGEPKDESGDSLLITACKCGFSEVIQDIVKIWDEILDEGDKDYSQTPLAWACESGYKDSVEILISLGADVNKPATGWKLFTPLHFCAQREQFETMNLIIEKDTKRALAENQQIDGRLKLEERDSMGRTPLQISMNAVTVDAECVKAIKSLLLHDRISPGERLRCLKEMVRVCQSEDTSELKLIFADGLQKIAEENLIQDFLLWLVDDRESIDIDEGHEKPDASALALLKPLAEAFHEQSVELRDTYTLIEALSNEEVRQIIRKKDIDKDSGRDTDGWSCATYIERYDRRGSLKDLANQVRKGSQPEEQDKMPKPIEWYCESEDLRKSFKKVSCYSHGDVFDFTVTKESESCQWVCVRTKHCIPTSVDNYYFEVEILRNSETGYIVLGFCGFDTGEDQVPGWLAKSWAYHGHDGKLIVDGEAAEDPNDNFGPSGTYGQGDTVGVYLDTKTGEGFCTKNGNKLDIGKVLDNVKEKFRLGKMYPCVGFGSAPDDVGLCFRVNLSGTGGYPFKYHMP